MESAEQWEEGGCHCGAVRFKVRVTERRAVACNCSICAKKGFVNVISTPENFELLSGEDELRSYRFNTEQAEHRFCCICGIHPFSRPRSHPGAYDVNGRCLDAGLDGWDIEIFDGIHWEENVAKLQ